jgi:hypothetical protein
LSRAHWIDAGLQEKIGAIRLLDVTAERRAKIEEVLRQYGRDTQIVEAGQPAHFLVDVKDHTLKLYSADGYSSSVHWPWTNLDGGRD